MQSFTTLGYTYLFSPTIPHTLHLYRLLPAHTIAILASPATITHCLSPSSEPGPEPWTPYPASCIKTPKNPTGIPLWKLLAFEYWPWPAHPLGKKWTLSPEPYELQNPVFGNTYVGYSVEDACALVPFVDSADRPGGQEGSTAAAQAYVMAKRLGYFAPGKGVWPNDFYEAAAEDGEVQFVVGAAPEDDFDESVLPQGMVNYGKLGQKEFVNHLASARVLVGIGNPIV